MFVRVTNNTVELIGDNYQVIRTIATSAQTADRHEKSRSSVVVHTNGDVILYDDSSRVIRTLTTGGSTGVFSGSDVIVRKTNGKTEVWSSDGRLLRVLDSVLNLKKLLSDLGL